jgi:hypothetical protein
LRAFFRGNLEFAANQGFGVGDGINALELQDQAFFVGPEIFQVKLAAGAAGVEQEKAVAFGEAFGEVGKEVGSDFADAALCLGDTRDRDKLAYSRISSAKRRSSFMPDALRMVRMARAVRPCLPMTFPTSPGATRNSSTVQSPSWTSCTETWSGVSTSVLAMYSIRGRKSPLGGSAGPGVVAIRSSSLCSFAS